MRRFFTVSFIVTQLPVLVALIGIGLLNWTYARSLADTREAVAHSLRVNTAIHAVMSQVQDIEVGQRGYLLTREADYLEPYEQSRASVDQTLAGLAHLVADSQVQTQHVGELALLVQRKLAEIDVTLKLSLNGQTDAALAEVRSDRGKIIMDDLRLLVAEMRQEEQTLLDLRTAQMKETEGRALFMVIAGLFLTIAARIVSGFLGLRFARNDQPEKPGE